MDISNPPPFDEATREAISALAEKLQRIAAQVYAPTPQGWRIAEGVLLDQKRQPLDFAATPFEPIEDMRRHFSPDARTPIVIAALEAAAQTPQVMRFSSGSDAQVWLLKPDTGDVPNKVVRFSQYQSRRMAHPLMIPALAEASTPDVAHAEVLPLAYVLTISHISPEQASERTSYSHDLQPFACPEGRFVTTAEAQLVMNVFKAVFGHDRISCSYQVKDLGLLPDGTICRVDPGDMQLQKQFFTEKELPDFSTAEYGREVHARCKALGLPSQFFWTEEDGSWKMNDFFMKAEGGAPMTARAQPLPKAGY